MTLQSINPATEEIIATFEEWSAEQVESAIQSAHEAFAGWSRVSFKERAAILRMTARCLRERKPHLARLATLEMGKPIVEAEAEIDKCAWVCDFYAENGEQFLTPEPRPTNASHSYVAFEPVGVVLGIMPWNFPFWQAIRFAAPTLMAGNTVLLKHASNVTQCSLAVEEIFRESGLPSGVFRSLLVPGSAVGSIIEDSRVRGVSLTGSSDTGAHVASVAGRALKKCVLELGGSDPFIVLADADLKEAASTAAKARLINSGQSCIAAKRFIVVEEVADEFERLFAEAISRFKVGDPLERETQVGPLARADLRDTLEDQVSRSVEQGAKIVIGGERPNGKGYFYAPTLLTSVRPGMPVADEETFGPVAAVLRVRDTEEAIELANSTPYGLGASLWTQDTEYPYESARRIEAGSVFINGMVASDVRLPFGGVKQSGYGRELSEFGIREFVNVQTVWIGPARGPQIPVAE